MGGMMEDVKHILLAYNPDLEIHGRLSGEVAAKTYSRQVEIGPE